MGEPESDPDRSRPDLLTEEVLTHYGTKGMHWGVRKSTESSGPTAVTVKPRTPGRKVTTTGGKGHPATEDAMNAAVYRQMAKKSSTDSLTTKQLTDLVGRMNMEQQYERLRLSPDPRNTVGQKFAIKVAKAHGAELVSVGLGSVAKSHPTVAGVSVAAKIAAALAPKKKKK